MQFGVVPVLMEHWLQHLETSDTGQTMDGVEGKLDRGECQGSSANGSRLVGCGL